MTPEASPEKGSSIALTLRHAAWWVLSKLWKGLKALFATKTKADHVYVIEWKHELTMRVPRNVPLNPSLARVISTIGQQQVKSLPPRE
jgi:hypothetical protein